MVLLAVNPKIVDAEAIIGRVVNGGYGLTLASLVSTDVITGLPLTTLSCIFWAVSSLGTFIFSDSIPMYRSFLGEAK